MCVGPAHLTDYPQSRRPLLMNARACTIRPETTATKLYCITLEKSLIALQVMSMSDFLVVYRLVRFYKFELDALEG